MKWLSRDLAEWRHWFWKGACPLLSLMHRFLQVPMGSRGPSSSLSPSPKAVADPLRGNVTRGPSCRGWDEASPGGCSTSSCVKRPRGLRGWEPQPLSPSLQGLITSVGSPALQGGESLLWATLKSLKETSAHHSPAVWPGLRPWLLWASVSSSVKWAGCRETQSGGRVQSRMVCKGCRGWFVVACSCETSDNVLFSTTPHKRSWEWRLRAQTASSKDCARCDPEGTGEGRPSRRKGFFLASRWGNVSDPERG